MSGMLHRMRDQPSAAQQPARDAFDIPEASDPSYWENTGWNFYQSNYTGETYTQAAQLTISADLSFTLFLYTGFTYGGGNCEQYVLDSLRGVLQVETDPSLWLNLPGTGDEQLKDTC